MIAAALVEIRIYLRNPQLVVLLVAIPLTLVAVLSRALGPVYGGGNPYQSTVPGFTVMFAFFGTAFAADAFLREREWGNWPRLLSLPIDRRRLVAGKSLAPLLVVSAQLVLLLTVGTVAYDLHLGSPFALALMVAATAAAGCAPGLLLAAVVRSRIELDQLANVFVVGLGSIGGAVVPVERMPALLRFLAPATPQYWALHGFERVMGGHGGLPDIVGPLMFLSAFAFAAHLLGGLLFGADRMMEPAR